VLLSSQQNRNKIVFRQKNGTILSGKNRRKKRLNQRKQHFRREENNRERDKNFGEFFLRLKKTFSITLDLID
jgi:hypothetical protein